MKRRPAPSSGLTLDLGGGEPDEQVRSSSLNRSSSRQGDSFANQEPPAPPRGGGSRSGGKQSQRSGSSSFQQQQQQSNYQPTTQPQQASFQQQQGSFRQQGSFQQQQPGSFNQGSRSGQDYGNPNSAYGSYDQQQYEDYDRRQDYDRGRQDYDRGRQDYDRSQQDYDRRQQPMSQTRTAGGYGSYQYDDRMDNDRMDMQQQSDQRQRQQYQDQQIQPAPQANNMAMQRYQPKPQGHTITHMVPLPRFTGNGVYDAPDPTPEQDAEVGRRRREEEYKSAACHLGQYDYDPTQPPVYYPRQEIVDKKEWADDPFFGWRTDPLAIEEAAATRRRRLGLNGRPMAEIHNQKEAERWAKDPFHGWLRTGAHMYEAGQERVQEARQERKLMSLPSFSADERARIDGGLHHEYAAGYQWNTRIRDDRPNVLNNPDRQWKDDAFYGWLPGRGVDRDRSQSPPRPLEQARMQRLPSFSEREAQLQAQQAQQGRRQAPRSDSFASQRQAYGSHGSHDSFSQGGLGVLTVRVLRAQNLINADTGWFGDVSDPYVSLKMKSRPDRRPVRTKTIKDNLNPVWDETFLFQIDREDDTLICEVFDEDTYTADDPLGAMHIPIEPIVASPHQSISIADNLQDVAHGRLELEVRFAPN
mmetsp:Transcript_52151/g.124255  ORF Transcript_52151/g.124255 Transcript_52151/m.124255 type:complete len:641 (+) Transcript_52151:107-2029(+)